MISFKQQLSGRRPEKAKLSFLCVLIGRRLRLLVGLRLNRCTLKGCERKDSRQMVVRHHWMACLVFRKDERVITKKTEETLPDPTCPDL